MSWISGACYYTELYITHYTTFVHSQNPMVYFVVQIFSILFHASDISLMIHSVQSHQLLLRPTFPYPPWGSQCNFDSNSLVTVSVKSGFLPLFFRPWLSNHLLARQCYKLQQFHLSFQLSSSCDCSQIYLILLCTTLSTLYTRTCDQKYQN